MWRISIKTEQNKEYLLSKFIKCLGCDLSRSFPWFTCMESAFTWNTPVDLKNGGQTLDFLPFSGSAYEPPVIFVSSLQQCWAEIFPYRLSIVLYFFINCNFISNIVTDKVGLDNANGCSNVLPSGWVDFSVWLWSHWNSATNAHFHHFAKGRGKLIVFLV